MRIGAQLYTVREHTKTLEDFSTTLAKIADIGYEYVQVSGTCPFEADWLAAELKKNGLKCGITHTDRGLIMNETDKVIADHKIFECDYVGIGWYDLLKYGTENFVNEFSDPAKKIAASGLHLSYHNHDFEFAKGNSGDIYLREILRSFTPDELKITLDTFWVQAGGADPVWWIKELKGRTPCVHFKDMSYGRRMEAVGSGNMNFDAIIAACHDTGVDYAFVEQDDCNGEDPFKCLKSSYEFLKAKGLK